MSEDSHKMAGSEMGVFEVEVYMPPFALYHIPLIFSH